MQEYIAEIKSFISFTIEKTEKMYKAIIELLNDLFIKKNKSILQSNIQAKPLSQERLKDFVQDPNDKKELEAFSSFISNEIYASNFEITHSQVVPLNISGQEQYSAYHCFFRETAYMLILPKDLNKEIKIEELSSHATVSLYDFYPPRWKNIFTDEEIISYNTIDLKRTLGKLTFGLYKAVQHPIQRRAGLLCHITSLPGKFGCGSLGTEAYDFIDLLHKNKQTYWQILPVNATDQASGYSPYSGISAFAGNDLLIDPFHLEEEGLLHIEQINKLILPHNKNADFHGAENNKRKLFDIAYKNFTYQKDGQLKQQYLSFCENEKFWLNDFAEFSALRNQFENKSWKEWPIEFRERKENEMEHFRGEYFYEIEKTKFKQYIFDLQWKKLKRYAYTKNVNIFGDAPIYIGYNSADVWANPEIFMLNPDKSMKAVAGVPPDYFNDEGQFWNMPIYDWEKLKSTGYNWWIQRIKKNLEWFDLVRLDHFRGFSAYWEIPGNESTAKNGKWVKGPGNELFDVLQKEFSELPLVAEDLGDIDQDVNTLRDHYELPGMKVLQFAFGENQHFSEHIPHYHLYNNIVYTGTHDNNTTKGWYEKETDNSTKNMLRNYTGKKFNNKNICEGMITLAYQSNAKIVIIPIQDTLELDESCRMNKPATTEDNWKWKLVPDQIKDKHMKKLRDLTRQYGRF